MTFLCKADSAYDDSKMIHFLLQVNRDALLRLIQLMELVRNLKKQCSEISSVHGAIDGLGHFVESPELLKELKKALRRKDLDEELEMSWVEIPQTFIIRTGYDELPLGALDVVIRNGIIVFDESVSITATQKNTMAHLESQPMEYDFLKRLADL